MENLPFSAIALLCKVLNIIESLGKWPIVLLFVPLSFLPKTPFPKASQFRGLAKLSILYRRWASVRFKNSRSWIVAVAHPAMVGAMPAKSTRDIGWTAGLQLEISRLIDETHYLLSIDASKLFDFLLWPIIFGLANFAGMPLQVIKLILHMAVCSHVC